MGTYSVFGQGARGGSPFGVSAGGPYTMGMEIGISLDCYATHIWCMRLTTAHLPTVGRLYSVASATTGTAVPGTDVTFNYGSETGWINAPLDAPVLLTGGTLFRVCIQNTGAFTYTNTFWTTGGAGATNITNGSITGYTATATTGGIQCQFKSSATLAYPTSGATTNYWIDLTVTDTINERPRPITNIQQAVTQSNTY